MTEDERKSAGDKAGKRGPQPVVIRKPKPPIDELVSGRKRSLAVSMVLMGALTLGVYETFQWIDRKLNCEPDPANPDELICKHHSGSTYRSSSGWHWSSGSRSSAAHGAAFGGFGHASGFFGGGG